MLVVATAPIDDANMLEQVKALCSPLRVFAIPPTVFEKQGGGHPFPERLFDPFIAATDIAPSKYFNQFGSCECHRWRLEIVALFSDHEQSEQNVSVTQGWQAVRIACDDFQFAMMGMVARRGPFVSQSSKGQNGLASTLRN